MNPMKSSAPHGVGGASAATARILRFAQLSGPRQALVRLCQSLNFGQICGLEVRDSEPVFSPSIQVSVDVKLGSGEGPRPEINLADFVLPGEVCGLVEHLDKLKNATVERIEVQAGVPRRIVFRTPLSDGLLGPFQPEAREDQGR
jgi:hypothetical protein